MVAEKVPKVDVDIPEEDAESIRADGGFGHSAEACETRSKQSPRRPSSDAIEAHYRTQCPFRSWCPACVAASGREEPHRREKGRAAEDGHELMEEQLTCPRGQGREHRRHPRI